MIPLRRRRVIDEKYMILYDTMNIAVFNDELYFSSEYGQRIYNLKTLSYEEFKTVNSWNSTNVFTAGEHVIWVNAYNSLAIYTKYREFVCTAYNIGYNEKIYQNIYWNKKLYILTNFWVKLFEMNEDGECKFVHIVTGLPQKILCCCSLGKLMYLGLGNGNIVVYNMELEEITSVEFERCLNGVHNLVIHNDYLYVDSLGCIHKYTLNGKRIPGIAFTVSEVMDLVTRKLVVTDLFVYVICSTKLYILSHDFKCVRIIESDIIDRVLVDGKEFHGPCNYKSAAVWRNKLYVVSNDGFMTEYGELYQHMLGSLSDRELTIISPWQSSWRNVGIQKDLAFLFTTALIT
jgi:hypothetical protein